MQPKPKPKKPRRPMSASEYDRYASTLAEASRRTQRYLITTGNPMEPENRVDVATGGKVTSRQKFTLGESYAKKDSGTNLPGPGKDNKNKGTNYKGYNKGTPSPSSYGKRP